MKINPCPNRKCGASPDDQDPITKEFGVVATCYGEKTFVVQCNVCGMSGPIEDTKQASVDAWNELSK